MVLDKIGCQHSRHLCALKTKVVASGSKYLASPSNQYQTSKTNPFLRFSPEPCGKAFDTTDAVANLTCYQILHLFVTTGAGSQSRPLRILRGFQCYQIITIKNSE